MNDASSIGSDQHLLRHDPTSSNNEGASTAAAANDAASLQEEKKRAQRDQKATMLDHLIRNVDIMIYAQLSVLYYMDCSLLYFLMRALPHWFYFTPKPSIFPPPPATHRPYVSIIFGTNILCILLHLMFAPPAAGEATRGYLHGGWLIDFVGQKSPVGRWTLLSLDLVVLALQILVLGVTLERRKTGGEGEGLGTIEDVTSEQRQDHDSEERGVIRQHSSTGEVYEMQDLQQSYERTHDDDNEDEDEMLRRGSSTEPRNQHPLDPYYTGEHIIASLHLSNMLRTQWQARSVSDGSTNNASASGVQAAVVAAAAGRTLTYRLGEGIQNSA